MEDRLAERDRQQNAAAVVAVNPVVRRSRLLEGASGSPTETVSTPALAAAVRSVAACCLADHRGNGMRDHSQPRRFLVSPGFTPEKRRRTWTSPGPGCGSGSSPTSSTSLDGPCRSYQTAPHTSLLFLVEKR